jgi:enterochelin esterase-like enzyme
MSPAHSFPTFLLLLLIASSPAHPQNESFAHFIARVHALPSGSLRTAAIQAFVDRSSGPVTEDSSVSLYYQGTTRRVGVPGDLNGWNPAADTMDRIEGTDFFYLSKTLQPAARFEYKFVVDSSWILDPANPLQATGGFGPNSEVRMPAYRSPADIEPRPATPKGTIDSLAIPSATLGVSVPLYVYQPVGYGTSRTEYPVIIVIDGGEYLSLGLMNVVMDNLIADGRMRPVLGVFLDPRTDPADSRTSRRMTDYAMSDDFVRFLADELHPWLRGRYRMLNDPGETAVAGASLGALQATYAAFTRPDVFGLCAAQSPAYWWKESRLITLIASAPRRPFRVYMDTGTIQDAQEKARVMRETMRTKGYPLHYEEHPESHNWANWRARIGTFLTHFWGTR